MTSLEVIRQLEVKTLPVSSARLVIEQLTQLRMVEEVALAVVVQ